MKEMTHERTCRRDGDPCPACGKPLMAVRLRSLATLGRARLYLMCEGYPKCDYREPVRSPKPANDG
jgi:ssDNA-binding Zn-finger/Zn-ribbon topoisomerase 1